MISSSRAGPTLRAYEAFLKKAEELVKRMAKKAPTAGVPRFSTAIPRPSCSSTTWPAFRRRLFSVPLTRTEKAKLALEIDLAMREKAPAGWKGDDTREKQVLNALFPIMARDRKATQAIFEIIKNKPGY